MKVPLNWLSIFCDIRSELANGNIDEIAHRYSVYTAEVDGVEHVGQNDTIVIGKVLDTKQHPDADKLNVCNVDTGRHGKFQIVCGAPNVIDAKYVAVALVGTQMSEDFIIEKRPLRGVDSCGMICSEDELGLQDERAPGIMRLEEYFPGVDFEKKLGEPFYELELPYPGVDGKPKGYKLSDTIFDLDNKFITNRPDLFGVYGNAREFGALFKKSLKQLEELDFKSYANKIPCEVTTKHVDTYSLTKYENIKVTDSPVVIQTLLKRSEHGVINNIVDITNIVTNELPHPMHCFDADKVAGKITIRQAKDGEKLLALDDKEYELTSEDTVVADEKGVIAIAGIIGGKETGVEEGTQDLLIEAGTWDPITVRKTSQRLGLRTDALIRFEKAQDPTGPRRAQKRFEQLLQFCIGKEHTATDAWIYEKEIESTTLEVKFDFLNRKIGVDVKPKQAQEILERLGFEVQTLKESFKITVPTWRATKDVSIPEDIVEEVARLVGYDTIPLTPLSGKINVVQNHPEIIMKDALREYFAARDVYDTYAYTFTSKRENEYFEDQKNWIEVSQPYSEEYAVMRSSIFGPLLGIAKDHKRRFESFSFFECGPIFSKAFEETQKLQVGGVFWNKDIDEIRDILSGCLEQFAPGQSITIQQGCPESHTSVLHPNKSGTFQIGEENKTTIIYGYANPILANLYDLDANKLVLFEIIEPQIALESTSIYTPLAKYPGIDREMNFVMDEKTPVGDIARQISQMHDFIGTVGVREVFRDEEKLGKDKKSVLFTYRLQNPEDTLTDEQAGEIQESIVSAMKKKSIELRS